MEQSLSRFLDRGVHRERQIAVEWSDYARKDGPLRIHRTRVWGHDKPRTKTHQARDIELLEQARLTIERQRATTRLTNGAIFWNPNTSRPWKDEQVQRRFWVASLHRCGLRHREQYQTRHTFATLCLMAGANPAWVARQMGHKSLKMFFEVYARWIYRVDKGWRRRGWMRQLQQRVAPPPHRVISLRSSPRLGRWHSQGLASGAAAHSD